MATKLQKAIKKLEQNEGVWFDYGHPSDQYSANVNTEKYTTPDGDPSYSISCHKGEMPAFDGTSYSSIEELAKAALEIQPDLRKWRTSNEQ